MEWTRWNSDCVGCAGDVYGWKRRTEVSETGEWDVVRERHDLGCAGHAMKRRLSDIDKID